MVMEQVRFMSTDTMQGETVVGYQQQFRYAFVLNAVTVERIWALLQPGAIVSAEAECADGSVRVFHNAPSLANYSNSKTNRILTLTIKCSLEDDCHSVVWLTFSQYIDSPPTKIIMNGKYGADIAFREKLLDELSGMKCWYSFISRGPLPIILSFLLIIPTYGKMLHLLDIDVDSLEQGKWERIFYLISIPMTWAIIYFALKILHVFFFPSGYFAIGQGLERYSISAKIRKFVVYSSIGLLSWYISI